MTSPASPPIAPAERPPPGRPGGTSSRLKVWLTPIVAALALLAVPTVTGDHVTALLGRIVVLGLLAMSLDLLWGYAGQLSFGHAAFFGLGAYATGLILKQGEGTAVSLLAVAAGVLVPAAAGLVLGSLLFRGGVGGVYFAIVTLLVSLLLEQLAITWSGFTGGINGLFGMSPLQLGPVTIGSLESAYYLIIAVTLACYLAARWLTLTAFGRALRAIRSDEHRARTLGYPVVGIKTAVFGVACGLAGVAGMLYVPLERFVYPSQLGLVSSTAVIVWVAIGGRGTLYGPFLGAFAVEYLASTLAGSLQRYYVLVIGLFLVLVATVWPGGLASLAGRRRLPRPGPSPGADDA